MFQRNYVWKEDPQWATLWDDIAEKAELQLEGRQTNAHYLGALIIEGVRPTSPREVKRFLVIDGQQRLTTIQLLLCAFRDLARKAKWTALDTTVTRLIENANPEAMEHPDEERFKIWPTTLNRDVFRSIISAGSGDSVEELYPLIRLPRRRRPEPRPNLVEAYLYFTRKIESWLDSSAERTQKAREMCAFELLLSLQRDFAVVEISLSEGDDSQEIFYSLNSQGAPLSQSDLLRSLIFMRAEKEKVNRDEIFEEYWSRFESPFWSTEIKRAGRPFSRLDLGLRYFLMAKTGELVDARRVSEEYRKWISSGLARYSGVREELADFSGYADLYQQFEVTPTDQLPSTDFRRVLHDLDVSTALPLVLYLERDSQFDGLTLRDAFAYLESFIVRRAITGAETREYNKFFVEIIRALREVRREARLSMLVKKLTAGVGTTRNWPTDIELISAVGTRELGTQLRTPALRLILERLELASRTKKSEGTAIPSSLQVEHVMPQSWSAHWLLDGRTIPHLAATYPTWSATGELAALQAPIIQRNRTIQTLGNLTLLNEYANPAASNGPFETKLTEYKHSVLRLNRYFDQLGSWNEDAIRARGRHLGEMLVQIWPKPDPEPSSTATQ
jgi:hypothetical protein